MFSFKVLPFFFLTCTLWSQVTEFPHLESFDSVVAPQLPAGWSTSTNRSSSGDFATTASSPYTSPNAVLSTNAAVAQNLLSPALSLTGKEADSLLFYERRSSSHNSGVMLEASIDNGQTFPLSVSDTLKNPGTTSYVLRKFKLPPQLSGRDSVVVRWRVIGNGTGTTGTIRFDNIKITALDQIDAGVNTIRFLPVNPIAGDSVIIRAVVQNFGTQPIQNIGVEFYADLNADSLPQPTELIGSATILQQLLRGDTTTVDILLINVSFGEKTIMVRTVLIGDRHHSNDLANTVLNVGLQEHSVVINEIMYAPVSPEPEWIEIVSTIPDSVNLKKWSVSDVNSRTKYVLTISDFWLHPNEFMIITKDSNGFSAQHPSAGKIVTATGLPSSLWNNGGDAVVLFDGRGAMMDSVRYMPSWGGADSTSLERVEVAQPSNDSTNWGSSLDSSGNTAGKQNYLTPLEYDLHALRVSVVSYSSSEAIISLTISNAGRQSISSFSTSLFFDANEDSLTDSAELIETRSSNGIIARKDSQTVQFVWINPPSGLKRLIATVDFNQDMRPSDNILFAPIKLSFPKSSFVVNEIMYDPLTGQSEYVELFNRTGASIDIHEWRISDVRDTSRTSKLHVLSQTRMLIGAGEFLVVAQDSVIFSLYPYLSDSGYHVVIKKSGMSLNNDGDEVLLTDLTGEAIDSVRYSPSWHNAEVEDVHGRALERINPNLPSNDSHNWSTSANPIGGSPGKQNSIFAAVIPSTSSLSFSPNPFSPDGDGFEDHTVISYDVSSAASIVRIRIFDVKGRIIRTLSDGEPSGSHGEIIWDGFTDQHEKTRMGIYVVLLEALDANRSNVQTIRSVVVVAARM